MRAIPSASPRCLVALAALGAAMLAPATPAVADDPAKQPPFGPEEPPELTPVRELDRPPPGFELDAAEAISIADRAEEVVAERRESPTMRPVPLRRGAERWQVEYLLDGEPVAQAIVDDRTGALIEAWRDHQVEVKLARGYEGAVAGKVSAWWIWIPLCLLFVAPFVDPRRPFRLLHLDLLVLLGFSVSLLYFNRGEIVTSVPLVYPALGYLFVRMLIAGLRPRDRQGSLVPLVPIRWLAVAAVGLALFRVGLNVTDSQVIDIGFAGVVGADRITSGEEIYDGSFPAELIDRGDSYGPFNYIAYVPFELAFPWGGGHEPLPAAHAAAISFDLAVVALLFLLGRRLRAGREGTALGVALAFAWLAYPFTLYGLNANGNDALVAALLLGALLAWSSAAGRGAVLALGAAAKFGPLALAPLFAAGTGERRWRSLLPFGLAFVAVWAIVALPLMPDGGPRELYDRTFGYQASRGSPFSVWGLKPSLSWLQDLSRALPVLLGLALFLVPGRRSPIQLAALGAALLIATQVGSMHWFYFFILWFAPYVLVNLFATQARIERAPGGAGVVSGQSESSARPAAAS